MHTHRRYQGVGGYGAEAARPRGIKEHQGCTFDGDVMVNGTVFRQALLFPLGSLRTLKGGFTGAKTA